MCPLIIIKWLFGSVTEILLWYACFYLLELQCLFFWKILSRNFVLGFRCSDAVRCVSLEGRNCGSFWPHDWGLLFWDDITGDIVEWYYVWWIVVCCRCQPTLLPLPLACVTSSFCWKCSNFAMMDSKSVYVVESDFIYSIWQNFKSGVYEVSEECVRIVCCVLERWSFELVFPIHK